LAAQGIAESLGVEGAGFEFVKKVRVEVQFRGRTQRLKRVNASRRIDFN
jgi:hypothetical protein